MTTQLEREVSEVLVLALCVVLLLYALIIDCLISWALGSSVELGHDLGVVGMKKFENHWSKLFIYRRSAVPPCGSC